MNDSGVISSGGARGASKNTGGPTSINNNNNSSRSGGNSGRSGQVSTSSSSSNSNVGRKHNVNGTPGRSSGIREKKSDKRMSADIKNAGNSSLFADEQETRLNSNVCKRMDPNFSKIIRVASQVGLYEYDCQAGKWTSAGISGCLFFYERSQSPRTGLIILNRNSLNNFLQLLTPEIEIQVDVPHILMNNHEVIRCLWFYSKSDCMDIANDLSKKLGISIKNQRIEPSSLQTIPSQLTPDVSGAQSTPAQLKSESSSVQNTPVQLKPELDTLGSTPQQWKSEQVQPSSGNQILNLLFNQQQQNTAVGNASSVPTKSESQPHTPGQKGSAVEDVKPKIKPVGQLQQADGALAARGEVSHPVPNSVPSEDPFSQLFQSKTGSFVDYSFDDLGDRISGSLPGNSSNRNFRGAQATGATPSKLDSLGDELRATLGIKNKSETPVNRWITEHEVDNALRDLHLDVENGLVLEDLRWDDTAAPAKEPAALNIDAMRMFVNDCRQFSDEELNGESRADFESRKAEIFEKERREAAIRQVNTRESESSYQQGPSSFHSSSDGGGDFLRNPAVLLSKEQMLQALSYLLKTDSEFTDKLHKAYLNSVLESRKT